MARAGSSLKATHSCFGSFQPLPENSGQRTYFPDTAWLVWSLYIRLWRKSLIAFSMTKLSPRGFKFKLPLLRDYLLPTAFELRNRSGPLKISLLHLLFMCLLLCLVVLLLSYINTQPGTRLGSGGSMPSPFIPFFFVCFFFTLLID